MDFSQFIDKIIELAGTPGGFIAALIASLPLALWAIGSYSKRMAEARKIEAETKKIRAQGDADADIGNVKNFAQALSIMQQQANNDVEKTRMMQAEFDKRHEESEQIRKTMEKVDVTLTNFNNESAATRFDNRAALAMTDTALLGLTSRVESLTGAVGAMNSESHGSHEWLRETVTSIHDKVVEMHNQVNVMYKLVIRPDKPPTPPTTEPDAPATKRPLPGPNADAGAKPDDLLRVSGL